MASFNKVIMMGNLTRDPELRTIPSGQNVCEFGIAVNEKYKGKETTMFLDCVAWGKTAEFTHNYKRKGDSVLLEGKLTQDSWEDKNTGQKRTKIKLTVMNVTPISNKGEGASGGQNERPAAQQPANTHSEYATDFDL